MSKPIFVIDGTKFSTFEEFTIYFSDLFLEDYKWNGNLDAFNDLLRGGFGTPEGGFVIHWKDSNLSRDALGYAATISWFESKIQTCHPSNVASMKRDLEKARLGLGETLFDWIVEIIMIHCDGGREAEDGLELILL